MVHNINSPTLTLFTGPTRSGPLVEVGKVKKGKLEIIEKFIDYMRIPYSIGKNYEFAVYALR